MCPLPPLFPFDFDWLHSFSLITYRDPILDALVSLIALYRKLPLLPSYLILFCPFVLDSLALPHLSAQTSRN